MDWSTGLAANNEVGAIKAALPIAYVLEYIGIAIYSADGRLHATCPFHSDRDPSFDIYPWRGGERWGCFVCSPGGDVLDLIQKIWPELRFHEAKQVAGNLIVAMTAADWKAPTLTEKPPFDVARAQELLRQGRSDGDAPAKLTAWCQSKRFRFTGDWLRVRYDVTVLGNEILMPYLNYDGHLVGLKHRSISGGKPLAMAGSELSGVFYGEWIWGQEKVSLLTEGESDTWTAAALFPDRCVLGLPTGAGTRPFGFDMLSGVVELAFDGDVAGKTGTKTWGDALKTAGYTVGVHPVPDGEDLTSWTSVD